MKFCITGTLGARVRRSQLYWNANRTQRTLWHFQIKWPEELKHLAGPWRTQHLFVDSMGRDIK